MEHGVHKMDASLEHYKNDNIKGPQHIPLAPKYIPMLVLLEHATQVSKWVVALGMWLSDFMVSSTHGHMYWA